MASKLMYSLRSFMPLYWESALQALLPTLGVYGAPFSLTAPLMPPET